MNLDSSKNWKIVSIGKLPIIIGDGNYSSKYPRQNELFSSGIPFISNKDIKNGRILSSGLRYLSKEKHNELKKGHLKTGDILVSTRANIGDVAWVDRNFNDANINAQLVFLRTDEKILHNKFLYYLLSSPNYKKVFEGFSSGSAQAQLPIGALIQVPILYPDLIDEQKEIADMLGSLDDKIELLRKENKTLESIAQTLFKEWFVNFNFPGSTGKMVESELGKIPERWKVESLTAIADFLNGVASQKYPAENINESLPVIKIKEMKSGITTDSDRATKNIGTEYIVKNGDLLFSWSGSLDVVFWNDDDGVLNQHLFKVTSKKYSKWFYYYWVLYHLPEFRSIAQSKATTMGHIQRHHLDDVKILLPLGITLEVMDSSMKPLLDRQINNNLQIRSLAKLRNELLNKIFTN